MVREEWAKVEAEHPMEASAWLLIGMALLRFIRTRKAAAPAKAGAVVPSSLVSGGA